MRDALLLAIALVSSIALAGCAEEGGGDGDDGQTTPTNASPTPTPSPTPGVSPPPVEPEPGEGNETSRKVVYNGTHDFASAPTSPTEPRTEEFTVDAGYAVLEIRIVVTGASAPTGQVSFGTAKVRVLDPTGAAVAECGGKDDPDCTKDVEAPAAGAWKVEYSGSGTVKASVTIAEDNRD